MTGLQILTEMPDPQYLMVGDGYRIATYSWGDDADPTVVVVHGFASSTKDNWVATGWVRDLTAAGFRVLALDQRGHGAIELDEDVYGDAAALSGVSKFSARVKCAMLAWVALEDAIAKA